MLCWLKLVSITTVAITLNWAQRVENATEHAHWLSLTQVTLILLEACQNRLVRSKQESFPLIKLCQSSLKKKKKVYVSKKKEKWRTRHLGLGFFFSSFQTDFWKYSIKLAIEKHKNREACSRCAPCSRCARPRGTVAFGKDILFGCTEADLLVG